MIHAVLVLADWPWKRKVQYTPQPLIQDSSLLMASVVLLAPLMLAPEPARKSSGESSAPPGDTKVQVRESQVLAPATNQAVSPTLRTSLVGFLVIIRNEGPGAGFGVGAGLTGIFSPIKTA